MGSNTDKSTADEGIGHTSDILCNDDEEDPDADRPTQGEEIDDFDPKELEALYYDKPAGHPLNRVQQIMAKAAIIIWVADDDELGRSHLAVLIQQLPQFGAD